MVKEPPFASSTVALLGAGDGVGFFVVVPPDAPDVVVDPHAAAMSAAIVR